MTCIAIIPARAGSKRLPSKNIKPFFGKPIMAYSIETARQSNLFDRIVVSTDCLEIAKVAKEYGAEIFERKTDDGSRGTQDVAREVLLTPGYECTMACVIYATSPLLQPHDLLKAKLQLHPPGIMYVMSVQQEPLADAGCFYFGYASAFRAGLPLIGTYTSMYPLPAKRCCDINLPADWAKAEKLYQRLEGK